MPKNNSKFSLLINKTKLKTITNIKNIAKQEKYTFIDLSVLPSPISLEHLACKPAENMLPIANQKVKSGWQYSKLTRQELSKYVKEK